MKMKPWHNITPHDLKQCKGPRGGLDEFRLARLLEANSCIKFTKVFPKLNLYYIYDQDRGIYVEMIPPEMKSFIAQLAYSISDEVARVKIVMAVCSEIFYGPLSEPGDPCFSKGKVVFLNGTLDLYTRQFGPWSPDDFLTYRMNYNYDPLAKCPTIDNFLLELCEGHKDRFQFLRSWLYILLFSMKESQTLLYIWGSGGTGKSTLAHLVTAAFIGREATITTTLKALHNDPFELSNIRGKKLILISDTEYYKGDLSILKMLTGGDSVTGRIKYVQGSHELEPEGQVLIVGNYPLGSRDTSGAISRRLRMFPADRKVQKRRFDLLSYTGNTYKGVLANELPGLFNSVLKLNAEEALQVVSDNKLTPSSRGVQRDSEERSNPLLRWVREELQPGEGSYLGYKTSKGIKEDLEMSRRKVLFPTFERWANRQGIRRLSHVQFAQTLILCLRDEGYPSERVKRVRGAYITGVSIKEGVYDRDYIYGALLSLQGLDPEGTYLNTNETLGSVNIDTNPQLYSETERGNLAGIYTPGQNLGPSLNEPNSLSTLDK